MGHTILDEIHAVRLERVQELLRNPRISYASLPDFCGYNSLVDLRRVFRKRTGLTMGEYRQSNASRPELNARSETKRSPR